MSAKRILVVEDDRFLRRACEGSLRQRGFSVLSAVDGEEGVRLAQAQTPDLILLDMLMPKMPGLDALRALKADERTRTIPVLVLSNSSRDGLLREAMNLGAVGYLIKSNISLQELAERVAQILEG